MIIYVFTGLDSNIQRPPTEIRQMNNGFWMKILLSWRHVWGRKQAKNCSISPWCAGLTKHPSNGHPIIIHTTFVRNNGT